MLRRFNLKFLQQLFYGVVEISFESAAILEVLRGSLDSRLLSASRETVEQLAREIIGSSSAASESHAVVEALASFTVHLPYKHDSLLVGVSRLIFSLISAPSSPKAI